MSTPPEQRSSDRFVAAALELFTEHGYAGTSLQMIGDRLGVSKAAVTYHFRSKSDLLDVLLTPLIEDLRALFDDVEAMDLAGRKEAALTAYADLLMRRRRVLAWLSRDVSVLSSVELGPVLDDFAERRDRLLALGQGPLVHIWGAAISMAMVESVSSAPHDIDDAFLRTEIERIGEVLVEGLVAAHARHGLELPHA